MTVERISSPALERIIRGRIAEEATIVIKFYSNDCYLCHGLREPYEDISNQYDDVLFFAFNILDHDDLDSVFPVDGTPSICLIKTGPRLKITTLLDPEKPDETMWFTPQQIKNFIDKEKR